MNRLVRNFISTGIACICMIAAFSCVQARAAEDAVVTADQAVQSALTKGDKAAANKWLDPDFSWIDSEGIMWAKEDAFRGGVKPLIAWAEDVKITEHKYGKSVVWIQWNEGNKYSARFWVKRPAGWKLLHTTEIAAMPKRDFQTVEPTYDIACNNPCKAVPYKPLT
ncbi:MAG TPA: nuclear transport factor 2 family protein, partial [Candidatus Acidoferrales bacterium]